MIRRELKIRPVIINGRYISKIVIDPHLSKHKEITDDLILDLVRELDGSEQLPDERKEPFEYYVSTIELYQKKYRLVWLLEDKLLYIGIITAFQDRKKRKT